MPGCSCITNIEYNKALKGLAIFCLFGRPHMIRHIGLLLTPKGEIPLHWSSATAFQVWLWADVSFYLLVLSSPPLSPPFGSPSRLILGGMTPCGLPGQHGSIFNFLSVWVQRGLRDLHWKIRLGDHFSVGIPQLGYIFFLTLQYTEISHHVIASQQGTAGFEELEQGLAHPWGHLRQSPQAAD